MGASHAKRGKSAWGEALRTGEWRPLFVLVKVDERAAGVWDDPTDLD